MMRRSVSCRAEHGGTHVILMRASSSTAWPIMGVSMWRSTVLPLGLADCGRTHRHGSVHATPFAYGRHRTSTSRLSLACGRADALWRPQTPRRMAPERGGIALA